jgi:hypothetical protein
VPGRASRAVPVRRLLEAFLRQLLFEPLAASDAGFSRIDIDFWISACQAIDD